MCSVGLFADVWKTLMVKPIKFSLQLLWDPKICLMGRKFVLTHVVSVCDFLVNALKNACVCVEQNTRKKFYNILELILP